MTANQAQVRTDAPTRRGRDDNGRGARLADSALFFRTFLAKGRTISSAVPSSTAMVDAVMAPIDFNRAANIVELGAGTGPITERLVAGLGSQHRFVAVENDRAFCRILRRRFPQVDVLEADATQLAKPLAERGIDKIDYVVSGLPTPSLPVRSMIRMWQWLRESLTPGGMFVQITVAPLVYRGFYDRLFESVRYRMVWRNVPPGGVYYCSRPRGATNGCSA